MPQPLTLLYFITLKTVCLKSYIRSIYFLTIHPYGFIMIENQYKQTVEAGITAIMPLQRVCGAEKQAGNRLSNGPLRAQSNVDSTEYSATFGQTSYAGDMQVSR
mgnify:CR=1 FL=1